MNRDEGHKFFRRAAILLRDCRDDRGEVHVPSSSIVYVWASSFSGDQLTSFLGHYFVPGSDKVTTVSLRERERGDLWDWDSNETGTLLVPGALLESVNRLCNAAFEHCRSEEARKSLMRIYDLVGLPLGPEFDRSQDPIAQHLRSQMPSQ